MTTPTATDRNAAIGLAIHTLRHDAEEWHQLAERIEPAEWPGVVRAQIEIAQFLWQQAVTPMPDAWQLTIGTRPQLTISARPNATQNEIIEAHLAQVLLIRPDMADLFGPDLARAASGCFSAVLAACADSVAVDPLSLLRDLQADSSPEAIAAAYEARKR